MPVATHIRHGGASLAGHDMIRKCAAGNLQFAKEKLSSKVNISYLFEVPADKEFLRLEKPEFSYGSQFIGGKIAPFCEPM